MLFISTALSQAGCASPPHPATSNSPAPMTAEPKLIFGSNNPPVSIDRKQNLGDAYRDRYLNKAILSQYDEEMLRAIRTRWYSLLDKFPQESRSEGYVVVEWQLRRDGSVRDVRIVSTTVSELLTFIAQRAVIESAPFGQTTLGKVDMRGAGFAYPRDLKFSFYYEK
jgi:outer membrane biosynthesis protein TonB